MRDVCVILICSSLLLLVPRETFVILWRFWCIFNYILRTEKDVMLTCVGNDGELSGIFPVA